MSRRMITRVASLAGMAMVLFADTGSENVEKSVVTHKDAAIILAKHSGLFDRYVAPDADLNECVAFLNRMGVYFGLMEVINGSEFTESDFARVMGQIDLVLAGRAEYFAGKVKLPKDIDSWEEYCTLNGVEYIEGYQAMLDVVRGMDEDVL